MTDQEIELLLNQALKDMFYSVLRLQERSVSKLANGNLSRTEMHALEIVQDIPDATLTQIADILGQSAEAQTYRAQAERIKTAFNVDSFSLV